MKRKHAIIIGIGLAVWLAETAAFGWNWHPQSYAEARWDGLGIVIILWGIIGDIFSGLEIHKHYNDNSTTNITTDKVNAPDATTLHYHFGTTRAETVKLLKKTGDKK